MDLLESHKAELHTASTLGLCALSVAFIGYVIWIKFFSALAGIPGPFPAAYTRLWLLYHTTRKPDVHIAMMKAHKKYGPVVRIAPDEVSISDPAGFREIYAIGSKYPKTNWYDGFEIPGQAIMLSVQDQQVHSMMRRQFSRFYSMSAVLQLERWVQSAVTGFMNRLKQEGSREIDLGEWLQLFAMDVVGEVTFSKRFGYIEAGEDDGIMRKLEISLRTSTWLGHIPWVRRLNNVLAPYIGSQLGTRERATTVVDFAKQAYADSRARSEKGNAEHPCVLSELIEAQRKKPDQYTEFQILQRCAGDVFAGSDTTAISLRSVVHNLLTHPRCLERLLEEMRRFREEGKLSSPVLFSEAQAMPYLQACIWEGMRLHPAVGHNLPRVVPEGGCTIAGRYLPAGTHVGANAWVIHRDESIYGPNPDEFMPERWLTENKPEMDRHFFSFGAGSRVCMGKNVALLEMSKLVATLFSEFHIEYARPGQPLHAEGWWFVKQEGLIVRLKPRVC